TRRSQLGPNLNTKLRELSYLHQVFFKTTNSTLVSHPGVNIGSSALLRQLGRNLQRLITITGGRESPQRLSCASSLLGYKLNQLSHNIKKRRPLYEGLWHQGDQKRWHCRSRPR